MSKPKKILALPVAYAKALVAPSRAGSPMVKAPWTSNSKYKE